MGGEVEREQREAASETPKVKFPKLPTEWTPSTRANSSTDAASPGSPENAFGMASSPVRKESFNIDCCTCDFVRKEFDLPSDTVGPGSCPFCRMYTTSFQ